VCIAGFVRPLEYSSLPACPRRIGAGLGSPAIRIVLGYETFASLGGAETYLLTVGEHLERLGHEVTIHTRQLGEMTTVARGRGLRVVTSEEALPADCDGVLVQDAASAYALAGRYPGARRVFVAHSAEFGPTLPPQAPGVCSAVVALNDRVVRQLEALDLQAPVVRLRQPVDMTRFGRLGIKHPEPRRALIMGNYWRGPRLRMVERSCRERGLMLDHIGLNGRPSTTPERDMANADIVIGYGRCIVEGMASGLAVYVYGVVGGDGWVTPDSYPAVEADGFAGRGTPAEIDEAAIARDLAEWGPEMGERNRDLATRHHDGSTHVLDLVKLWRRLDGPPPAPRLPTDEMAGLVRRHWQAESRAVTLVLESHQMRWRAEVAERERDELRREIAALKARPRAPIGSRVARAFRLGRRARTSSPSTSWWR
jgi:glycosyltransferase involved in cell wall biosynthesis